MQTLSDGCAVVSHGSSNRLLDRVLIRKSIQARIVNTWLVLIAVLGTVIVVADGLTRAPVSEREAYWNGPLEYQPYLGAVLLAGLAARAVVGDLSRVRGSLTGGVFRRIRVWNLGVHPTCY